MLLIWCWTGHFHLTLPPVIPCGRSVLPPCYRKLYSTENTVKSYCFSSWNNTIYFQSRLTKMFFKSITPYRLFPFLALCAQARTRAPLMVTYISEFNFGQSAGLVRTRMLPTILMANQIPASVKTFCHTSEFHRAVRVRKTLTSRTKLKKISLQAVIREI